MKKPLFLVLSMFTGLIALNAKEIQLQSPDGNLQIVVTIDKEISWSAQLKGKPVLEKAVVAMELSDRVLGLEARLAKQSVKEVKQEIQAAVPYKDAIIEDHCNELSLQFRERFSLTFRAYNDGVAYRFSETSRKPYEVLNEKMDLFFPDGAACYFSEEHTTYSHNGKRLLHLVDQILDFRKIQANKMKLMVEETEICSFISLIMENFQFKAKEKEINYLFDAKEDKIYLWIDKDKFEKIIFNLLSNAFKYTPPGKSIWIACPAYLPLALFRSVLRAINPSRFVDRTKEIQPVDHW
jgi:hypothetical protein